MSIIDDQSLLKLGVKHQKWLENTSVNLIAYKLNNKMFYLAIYGSKFNKDNVKGKAILSPQSITKEEAFQAVLPHLSFSITVNNILQSTQERAKLTYQVWEDISDYIQDVIQNNRLDQTKKQVYKRAYETINSLITLQNMMKKQWEKFDELHRYIEQRGYFTDENVEILLDILIQSHIIQLKQFRQEYEHCVDFDVIYENRNKVRTYKESFDVGILKAMTSTIAKPQLKKSIDLITTNESVDHLDDSALYEKWLKRYKEQLNVRAEETISQLRYP